MFSNTTKLEVKFGDWVAVIGLGLLGQLAARILKAAGAANSRPETTRVPDGGFKKVSTFGRKVHDVP